MDYTRTTRHLYHRLLYKSPAPAFVLVDTRQYLSNIASWVIPGVFTIPSKYGSNSDNNHFGFDFHNSANLSFGSLGMAFATNALAMFRL